MPELLASVDPAVFVPVLLALVVIVALALKAWPFVRKLVQLVDTLSDLKPRLERIEQTVGVVRGEVTHNGGGSLKDAVRRIEQAQGTTDARLNRMEAAYNRRPWWR